MNTNVYKYIFLFIIIIYNLKFMGNKNWLCIHWGDIFKKKKKKTFIHMTLLYKLGRYIFFLQKKLYPLAFSII